MPNKEDIKEYLDALRASGAVNMMGAAVHLQQEFPEMSKKDARDALMTWMKEF